jgi:nucleoside-diphosphate-sugar epimerase
MGRRIVERLLERRHEVAVLHRAATHDLGPQVRNLQADRADLAQVAQHTRHENADAVFDLAYDWARGTPASQATDSRWVSTLATRAVGMILRACGPRRQLF